jgi:hypothetical protein
MPERHAVAAQRMRAANAPAARRRRTADARGECSSGKTAAQRDARDDARAARPPQSASGCARRMLDGSPSTPAQADARDECSTAARRLQRSSSTAAQCVDFSSASSGGMSSYGELGSPAGPSLARRASAGHGRLIAVGELVNQLPRWIQPVLDGQAVRTVSTIIVTSRA